MYLGYTDYGDGKTDCSNGANPYPHEMDGVLVYNNIIDNTGIDGIQVGLTTGDCRIYDNTITRHDRSNSANGRSGIQVNPGHNCDVYGNFINGGYFGQGIRFFADYGKIYNK